MKEEEEAAAESGGWERAPPVSQEEGSHFPSFPGVGKCRQRTTIHRDS